MDNKAASSRNYLHSIALGVGFLALLPLLIKQAHRMASAPMWWFPLLAPIFLAYVVWQTNHVGVAAHPLRRWISLGLMATGAFLGLVSTIAESRDFAQLSFLLILTGWALIRQGIVPWTRVVACCAVFWVAWPLPFALTERFSGRINREAITTASGILDQLNVKHSSTSAGMDLKTTRLNLIEILDHSGSLPALLFLTLMIVLFTRHPLLLSLLALGSAIVFSWLGDVLLILIQVWAVQSLVTNWATGWPLVITQVGVFVVELGLVAITLYSLSYLFDAVPVDSASKADKGWHGVFNRIVVWPLNFAALQEDEGPAYLEDDDIEEAPKKLAIARVRCTPSFTATRTATDPFAEQPRVMYATFACLALTGVFAVLCLIIPPRKVDPKAFASTALQMDNVITVPNEMGGLALAGRIASASREDGTWATGWTYSLPGGTASMTLEFPQIGPAVSQTLEGWTHFDVPHLYTMDGWEVLESEFVDSIGNRGYSWTAAFDRNGGNYSQGGMIVKSVRRLKSSILGRMLGLSVDELTYHCRFVAQPPNPYAMQRREELRVAFVSACKGIAQTIASQGGHKNGN